MAPLGHLISLRRGRERQNSRFLGKRSGDPFCHRFLLRFGRARDPKNYDFVREGLQFSTFVKDRFSNENGAPWAPLFAPFRDPVRPLDPPGAPWKLMRRLIYVQRFYVSRKVPKRVPQGAPGRGAKGGAGGRGCGLPLLGFGGICSQK